MNFTPEILDKKPELQKQIEAILLEKKGINYTVYQIMELIEPKLNTSFNA